MRYSLLFFANQDEGDARSRYELLVDSAIFADQHGFEAIWLPERHFHPFGGAFPNPALAACVVAAKTSRLRIRAGSLVLPLHDVLTAAEDWSVVDNVSAGRIDLSFAIGWNANDFVLAPQRYADRRAETFRMAQEFDELWKGRSIRRTNGKDEEVDIQIFPQPVQPELRYWLTCTASPERFVEAGEHDFNVLTALLFQTPAELKKNVDAFRAACPRGGPRRQVTLMLHTYLGRSVDEVREVVRGPFMKYLASSTSLWYGRLGGLDIPEIQSRNLLLSFAFQRYFTSAALFGTVDSCRPFISELAKAGIDEIACLIDFGLPNDVVLAGLSHIAQLAGDS